MVNKALRIVLTTIFTISLLFVVPFNNIYADSYTIKGHNVTLIESSYQNTESITTGGNTSDYNFYRYTYEIEYFLDDYYLGYIEGNFKYYYNYMPTTGSSTVLNATKDLKVYCNSDSFKFNISFTSDLYDPIVSTSSYITITSASLTKFSELNSISQIIDILQDIYSNSNNIEGLETNQLAELENIVSNTSLANQYLEKISTLRQWNIPFESLGFIYYFLVRYDIYDVFNNDYLYQFPIFYLNPQDIIYSTFTNLNSDTFNNGVTFVLGSNLNISNINSLISNLGIDSSLFSVSEYEYINLINNNIFIVKFTVRNISGSNQTLTIKNNSTTNRFFIPIYESYVGKTQYISTDFALLFGLSNNLLDNIYIIANGTNASSVASSQSDQANSQLQQDSNTLFTQEDSFKQNMQQSMNNIDTTFSLNNFGSSFMTSAQWVRTQYETLTNNTPFASLITFSLLVGLALIVIGKVYK